MSENTIQKIQVNGNMYRLVDLDNTSKLTELSGKFENFKIPQYNDVTSFEVWATNTEEIVTKYIDLIDISNSDNTCGLLYDEQNIDNTLTEVSLVVPSRNATNHSC